MHTPALCHAQAEHHVDHPTGSPYEITFVVAARHIALLSQQSRGPVEGQAYKVARRVSQTSLRELCHHPKVGSRCTLCWGCVPTR